MVGAYMVFHHAPPGWYALNTVELGEKGPTAVLIVLIVRSLCSREFPVVPTWLRSEIQDEET